MENNFTDIQRTWIERLPQQLRPYAYIARLDRPVGVWLLFIPSFLGILAAAGGLGWKSLGLGLVFLIGAVIMRAAGCIINDIWDKDIDVHVERTATRPLASGELSMPGTLLFLLILLSLGALILFNLPLVSVIAGIIALGLVIAYPYMKRITYWPQAFLGLTFNMGIFIGWGAMSGGLSIAVPVLYVSAICWTIAYDTIYAHQDIEDDVKIGVKSTAILFGSKSKHYVSAFYALFVLGLFTSGLFLGAGGGYYAILAIAAGYITYILKEWDPNSQIASLQGFKRNITLGFILMAAFMVL